MATIRQRGNTYQIRVSCGIGADGKQVAQSITYTPKATAPKAREKEVQAFAIDFERKVKEGKYLTGEKLTFIEVTEHWRTEWAALNLSDGGADYLKVIKARAFPAFGNMKISKIMPLHIQELLTGMIRSGRASKTVHYAWVAINSVFRYAYRLRIIQENPCTRCELPKIEADTELHFFTEEQAKRFLNEALTMEYPDTIKGHSRTDDTGKEYAVADYTEIHTVPFQFRPLYALAIYGGFRRGELGALTWRDIDFDAHTVTISKAAALRQGGYTIKEPKTKKGFRTVTLPKVCFDLLRQWKSQEMKIRLAHGTAWKGAESFEDTFIFIQSDGKMMDLNTIGQKFKSILKRYNALQEDEAYKLPEIRFHDLRHTSATLLIGSGCDIETVSRRLGHSKASVTLDIYAHPLPENDRKAADILEKALAIG